jgi:hypothetical protein
VTFARVRVLANVYYLLARFVDNLLVKNRTKDFVFVRFFCIFVRNVFWRGMSYYLHTVFGQHTFRLAEGSMGLLSGSVQVQCASTSKQKEQADCVLR